MATAQIAAPTIDRPRASDARYGWLVLGASAWVIGGAFLDGWAHRHIATLDTFFTPWHGALYSGFAACAAVLGLRWLRDRSLPAGYGTSLLGVVLFGIGGVLDMLWHTFFGIERQIAAVLSPTHLLLILAISLVVTGPLRAALAGPGRRAPLFAVLAAAAVLAYIGIVTEVAQPYFARLAANPSRSLVPYDQAVELGLFGVMLQSGLLMVVVLKLRERFVLPFGALTVIMGLQGLLLGAQYNLDFMVLVAVLGGLAADVWSLLLRDRTAIFAFAVPATLYAIYVGSILLVYGSWWEVHALTGLVIVAGLTGWTVHLLLARPRTTAAARPAA